MALHDKIYNLIKIVIIDRHDIYGKVHNAQCNMRNYIKAHVALHDKVQTQLVFVVNDIHDMYGKLHNAHT